VIRPAFVRPHTSSVDARRAAQPEPEVPVRVADGLVWISPAISRGLGPILEVRLFTCSPPMS
jgi:hypothetical protein